MEKKLLHPLAFLVLTVLVPFTKEQCTENIFEEQIQALDFCQSVSKSIVNLISNETKDVETKCREAIKDQESCLNLTFGRFKKCQSAEQEHGLDAFRQSEMAQTKYYCQENGKNLKLFWKYEGLMCLKGSSVTTNCSIPKPRVVVRPSIKNCRGRREYLDCYKSLLHPKHCSEYSKKFLVSAVEKLLDESNCAGYLSDALEKRAASPLIYFLFFLTFLI